MLYQSLVSSVQYVRRTPNLVSYVITIVGHQTWNPDGAEAEASKQAVDLRLQESAELVSRLQTSNGRVNENESAPLVWQNAC
jgi:hypothetical protein